MKIGVVCASIYENNPQPKFAQINRIRLKIYCDRNGYDLYYVTKNVTNAKMSRQKQKWQGFYVFVNKLKDYDAIMWIDNDIFILDLNRKIESFLNNDKDLIFSRDIDWTPDSAFINMINSGIFIIKNTNIGNNFMKKAWNMRNFEGHNSKFGDQPIFNLLLINEFIQYADIRPQGELQYQINGACFNTLKIPLGLHFTGKSHKANNYIGFLEESVFEENPHYIIKNLTSMRFHKIYMFASNLGYKIDKIKTKHYV